MAIIAEGAGRVGYGGEFEDEHRPLAPVTLGGVFKCQACGMEDVGRAKAPGPHAHDPGRGPVIWRLIVALECRPVVRSLDEMRSRKALGRGGLNPIHQAPARGALGRPSAP